jgi:hypothetical protein
MISASTQHICDAYRAALKSGENERDVVGYLSVQYGVQRPAIWRRLRTGGVLPPYKSERGPDGAPLPRKAAKKRLRACEREAERAERPRVYRDPCPRCGTRRDIGCAHSQAPLGTIL